LYSLFTPAGRTRKEFRSRGISQINNAGEEGYESQRTDKEQQADERKRQNKYPYRQGEERTGNQEASDNSRVPAQAIAPDEPNGESTYLNRAEAISGHLPLSKESISGVRSEE
jgi:hypothetical protein